MCAHRDFFYIIIIKFFIVIKKKKSIFINVQVHIELNDKNKLRL